MPDPVGTVPGTAVYAGPSAEARFAGGERVGYTPKRAPSFTRRALLSTCS
jgi:hypothetical protein